MTLRQVVNATRFNAEFGIVSSRPADTSTYIILLLDAVFKGSYSLGIIQFCGEQ